MDIIACGSRPSRRMGAPSFTGTVWQDPIIQAPDPARMRSAWVRFEPGARTAWHTHPLGQTLHITSGIGRVQTWGGPVREDPRRRHGLDSARREALAWRDARTRHGTHRHAGSARRRARDMARAGDRRAIFGKARLSCAHQRA